MIILVCIDASSATMPVFMFHVMGGTVSPVHITTTGEVFAVALINAYIV